MIVISVEYQLITEKVVLNGFPCRYLVYLKDYSAIFNDHDWWGVLFTSAFLRQKNKLRKTAFDMLVGILCANSDVFNHLPYRSTFIIITCFQAATCALSSSFANISTPVCRILTLVEKR